VGKYKGFAIACLLEKGRKWKYPGSRWQTRKEESLHYRRKEVREVNQTGEGRKLSWLFLFVQAYVNSDGRAHCLFWVCSRFPRIIMETSSVTVSYDPHGSLRRTSHPDPIFDFIYIYINLTSPAGWSGQGDLGILDSF